MTCKDDCIHYNVCNYHIDEETPFEVTECNNFKNKADFVEVVRCGECKFTDKRCAYGIVCICEHGGMQGAFVSKTDYCNYGRRRDT